MTFVGVGVVEYDAVQLVVAAAAYSFGVVESSAFVEGVVGVAVSFEDVSFLALEDAWTWIVEQRKGD